MKYFWKINFRWNISCMHSKHVLICMQWFFFCQIYFQMFNWVLISNDFDWICLITQGFLAHHQFINNKKPLWRCLCHCCKVQQTVNSQQELIIITHIALAKHKYYLTEQKLSTFYLWIKQTKLLRSYLSFRP